MNKIFIYLVIVVVFVSALFFIPVGSGNVVEAPFGSMRYDIYGIDSEGNRINFINKGTVSSRMLSWWYENNEDELEDLRVDVYASATGGGYDTCELQMGDIEIYSVHYGNDEVPGGDTKGVETFPSTTFILPVDDGEVLIKEYFVPLDEFESFLDQHIQEGHSTSLDIHIKVTSIWGGGQFRGIKNGVPDPWQPFEPETFILVTAENVVYEHDAPPEPTCGDGDCAGDPYPGENCYTCPGDCGVCDAHIHMVNFQSGENVDQIAQLRYNYYNGNDWNGWDYCDIGDPIMVYYNRNMFSLISTPSTAGYLRAYCYATSYDTAESVYLMPYKNYDNSNLDEWVELDETGHAYFDTGYTDTHLLNENCDWTITAMVWYDDDGGDQDQYSLTVNTVPNNCNILLSLESSGTVVASGNSGDNGQYYIDGLYNDDYVLTVSKDGYDSDTSIFTLYQNEVFYISLDEIVNPTYMVTITTDTEGAQIGCNGIIETYYVDDPWMHELEDGGYTAHAWIGDSSNFKYFTVSGSPVSVFVPIFLPGQFVMSIFYMVTDESRSWDRYEYDGNYLGNPGFLWW